MYFVPTHLKGMNRKIVYEALASVGHISRAELARQTGISAPTVGKIISFFVRSGIVSEAGDGELELGRKPHMLRFNSESFFTVGVEFEGGVLKVGLVDLLGRVKTIHQVPVASNFDTIVRKDFGGAIATVVRESRIPESRIWGVGIGIPGVVDAVRGVINTAPLIGIDGELAYAGLIANLEKRLKMQVFLENDVNAAAIGEYTARKDQNESDLVYLSLGTGVGGGIILDGQLRKGKRFSAGEIGYMIFDKTSSSHTSQAGWLENRINRRALLKRRKGADFRDFAASELALVIANLAAVLDVDLFVIGGASLDDYGAGFLEQVETHVRQLSNFAVRVERQVCAEPGVTGAAAVAKDSTIDRRLGS